MLRASLVSCGELRASEQLVNESQDEVLCEGLAKEVCESKD